MQLEQLNVRITFGSIWMKEQKSRCAGTRYGDATIWLPYIRPGAQSGVWDAYGLVYRKVKTHGRDASVTIAFPTFYSEVAHMRKSLYAEFERRLSQGAPPRLLRFSS